MGIDTDTHTLNLDSRYGWLQHVFGLEANLFGRDPEPGAATGAYHVSAYWTYQFDHPPVSVAAAAPVDTDYTAEGRVEASIPGLAPGITEQEAQLALSQKNISGGVSQAGFVVYEYPLLKDVLQRQRLILGYEAGLLAQSALLIEFDDVGDRDSVMQTFERIRQTLIRQLGNPDRTFEQGDFTPGFAADVNAQRLVRIVEWTTPSGTIRFGIPRRLDNQVRMEIQHARRFPQPRETLWSFEEIR